MLEDVLKIPDAEGRRGLERAKELVRAFLSNQKEAVVKTAPGKVKLETKGTQ